jgi:hypothetical protein
MLAQTTQTKHVVDMAVTAQEWIVLLTVGEIHMYQVAYTDSLEWIKCINISNWIVSSLSACMHSHSLESLGMGRIR